MQNDPFSKLGALDQKLYQKPSDIEKKPTAKELPPTPKQQEAPAREPKEERPTHQSIDQSTERLTNRLNHPNSTKVMDKPRGFYITEQVNKHIDEAVRYYQEKHNLKKVDRSIVVTALLENESNWTEETLDLLLDRVISQLTNRLTNR